MTLNKESIKEEKVSFCTEPWVNLFLRNSGRVQPCCMNSTDLGNINRDDLDEIWNSKELQNIRRLIMEGNYQEAGCKDTCPIMYRIKENQAVDVVPKSWMKSYNSNKNFQINIDKYRKSIEQRKVKLPNTPLNFDIQPVEACNMGCIMCHQNHNSKDYVEVDKINKLFKYRENIYSIRFQGGEIFIDQNFIDYLINLKSQLRSDQKISVITNGSCLTHDELSKLTQGDNPVKFIISMDATDEKIFKYIRESSKFKKVKDSIEYLADIQKEKSNEFLIWNYIVMKSNFYNVKDAIMLAAKLDVSLALGAILGRYEDENIFDYPELRNDDYQDEISKWITLIESLSAKVTGVETILSKLELKR